MSEEIFVFGSNLAGRHGAGSARFAARFYGAESGVGVGKTGNSYAIPTKSERLAPLLLSDVHMYVKEFLHYASTHPEQTFYLTRIGCGLAGHKDSEIAPMFKKHPINVIVPYTWERLYDPTRQVRVIIAGSRSVTDKTFPTGQIDIILSKVVVHLGVVIVSGGARGADKCGEDYAKSRSLDLLVMPAEWKKYGREAGFIRNQRMAHCSSHLIAVWDGKSNGTKNMIGIAKNDGLDIRVLKPA